MLTGKKIKIILILKANVSFIKKNKNKKNCRSRHKKKHKIIEVENTASFSLFFSIETIEFSYPKVNITENKVVIVPNNVINPKSSGVKSLVSIGADRSGINCATNVPEVRIVIFFNNLLLFSPISYY